MNQRRKSSCTARQSRGPLSRARQGPALTRREFLKRTSTALATVGTGIVACAGNSLAVEIGSSPSGNVAIIADPADPVANSKAAQWAIAELKESLNRRQITVQIVRRIADVPTTAQSVLAAGAEQSLAREIL